MEPPAFPFRSGPRFEDQRQPSSSRGPGLQLHLRRATARHGRCVPLARRPSPSAPRRRCRRGGRDRACGADVVVASARGRRPIGRRSCRPAEESLTGTFALVPAGSPTRSGLPVVAAERHRGRWASRLPWSWVSAASQRSARLAWRAESNASPAHKAAISLGPARLDPGSPEATQGRLARGLQNRLGRDHPVSRATGSLPIAGRADARDAHGGGRGRADGPIIRAVVGPGGVARDASAPAANLFADLVTGATRLLDGD